MELPDPASLRKTYEGAVLTEKDLAADPVEQFAAWFADAVGAGLPEPNAMILSTATPDGRPGARTVLLKGFSAEGFRFFTNHHSRKGRELAANPRACLLFPWHPMRRQVIIEGPVRRLGGEESADYFASRPYGSRIGAWASEWQSAPVTRAELDRRRADLAERWPDEVPLPDFWGGYRVIPASLEFWQGRPDRLHDRLRYVPADPDESGEWRVDRLSP